MRSMMKKFLGHYALPVLVMVLAATVAASAQSWSPKPTAIPKVTGPIPVTADSRPFNAGASLQTPIDLAGHGYVEQEYFTSGTANLYDWGADGKMTVKASDRPYTDRILVRRPADQSRFNGTVVVEIMHSGRGFDNQMLWGFVGDYVFEHNAAYVALTVSANTIGALKMFDKARYGSLSFPPPVAGLCDAAPRAGGGGGEEGGGVNSAHRPAEFFPPSDDNVKWDYISQVGALLKSSSSPLPGVKYVFLMDHTASDTATYATALSKYATLANGKPVYDGFVVKEGTGPGPVSPCGGRLAPNDPRRHLGNAGAPIIFLMAGNYAARLSSLRREDSDTPGDQFRLYEIPGASHLDQWGVNYLPALKDQSTVGIDRPLTAAVGFDTTCDRTEPLSDFPAQYFYHAILANLEAWVRDGVPAPRGGRMEMENAGTPKATLVVDEFGNPKGGIRNPYVDVPAAKYVQEMAGRGPCNQIEYTVPFGMGKMEALYGSYKNYEAKFNAGVDQLVQQRWLIKSDGEKLKAEFHSRNAK